MTANAENPRTDAARSFVDNFEAMVMRLPPDAPLPAVGVKGADQTGNVTCVVDITGRLVRISIDDTWWDRLGPDRIGGAVLDAWRFAKFKALMARLVLDDHGRRVDQPRPDFSTIFAAEPSDPLPPRDDARFAGALARKADRALTILEGAERFRRSRDSIQRRAVDGPRGLFRVIVSGAQLVGAELTEHGLHRPSGDALAEDARAALVAAVSSAQPVPH